MTCMQTRLRNSSIWLKTIMTEYSYIVKPSSELPKHEQEFFLWYTAWTYAKQASWS